jgi:site-specific DNA recombinase
MRCAVYARYSSDLQRESSVEDQIRKCRTFAESKGWFVLEEYVRSDQEISGASLAGRPALGFLLAAAKRHSRPFDRILIDDTSRLSRNLADAHKMVATLRFNGVGVTFVSQNIDTLDKASCQLVTLNGMMDEQYLVGLADKVHRGQEGRVLRGLNPGGKLYGYNNVPILNPNRPGKYGQPAVDGVDQEINPGQAEVVVRIFGMYASGMGLALISKTVERGRHPGAAATTDKRIAGVVPIFYSGDAAKRTLQGCPGLEPNCKDKESGDGPQGEQSPTEGRLAARSGS